MSTESYMRATARENKVWAPFVHSFPFDDNQTTDRATIFGLYSRSHLNQEEYLSEIEAAELSNLLSDYNSKIAELTTQEQIVVADIVSKRYLATIDKLIHDQKMVSKRAEIDAEDDTWTAKIAALSADRAALDTLTAKVTSETAKTAARITELQAYIEIETVNLSEVDIQIAEKEIQSATVDIEKLNAENSILKIQVDTVNAAAQLIDVDLRISQTKVDVAHTDSNIAKIGLLDGELEIEQARTTIANAELPVAAARVTLAEAKGTEIDAEITHYGTTLVNQSASELEKKIALMESKQASRESELDQHKREKELQINTRTADSDLEVTLADGDATAQESIDQKEVEAKGNEVFNESAKVNAAVAATEKILAAPIKTKLEHTVRPRKTT
ncbi:MAG: hypothetical protein ACYC5X_12080 [Syntrophales bacterium]